MSILIYLIYFLDIPVKSILGYLNFFFGDLGLDLVGDKSDVSYLNESYVLVSFFLTDNTYLVGEGDIFFYGLFVTD